MIRKRRVLVNALAAVAQVVVVGGTFFVLYRFLRDTLGEEDFGVWTLVLATTSAGGIANLGLAASAVKFVSQHLARGDEVQVSRIVQTAVLSVGAFLAVVLAAAYPVLDDLLALIIEPERKLPSALAILPYALVSFWLTSVAGVLQSCLDGLHRVDLRGAFLSAGSLLYLGLAFLLVPRGGLVGLAQAQLVQSAVLLATCWVALQRLSPALPLVPSRWDRGAFTEMLGYSLQFQVISFSMLLLEPTVKALISKFGGVALLVSFEFAYRMVLQIRALLVSAHQALLPTLAELQERDPARLGDVYRTSFRVLLYLVVPSLGFFVAVTPLVSRVWIGAYDPAFVLFAVLLFVGWSFNLLSNPAYFANMSTGELRWNVAGHVVTGGLSGGLGLLLAWLFGGTGAVVGYVVAIGTGSLMTTAAYQARYGIPLAALVQRPTLWLGAASLAGLGVVLALYYRLDAAWSLPALALLLPATYLAFVLVPLWRHPLCRQVQAWLREAFSP